MRRVLQRTEVAFKSAEQEQAVHAVLRGQTPLVVILPTGGGKSLLFTVPAAMPEPGVTILVVPYRALIEDLVQRISRSGIECVEWTQAQTHPAPIVVASADVAGSPSFLQYALLLNEKKALRRVVIDECHLVITSSHWRPKLARLRDLRLLSCPVTLLTATLPPALEEAFSQDMLVSGATYIRASTVRPNIRYFVSWCARGKAIETAVAMCQRRRRALRDGKKGVIYCHTKAECERLAEALRCPYYHAGVADRADQLQQWLGWGGFIVATSALGTGVDFPGITFVLHVGMPWSMIDYCQESGRAGRSNEVADSVIVVEQGEVERQLQRSGESMDVRAMGRFLEGDGCRRGTMSEYMDGKRVTCSDSESAGCDRCGEGRIEWQQSQSEAASGWQEVEGVMNALRAGCAVCWVLGQDDWQPHKTMQCYRQSPFTAPELDQFRRGVRDAGDCHSCRRCWVSQKWCATGQDVGSRCQWPNVVIPVVRAATGVEDGLEVIRECGFQGECELECQAYQAWLGRRHTGRVWGEVLSNAMVVAIRVIQRLHREGGHG
jgi:superfamily II DNA helicase RecQ